jgi:hypothetical protein
VKIDWKKITTEELAARVSTTLQEHGIDAMLVGGACISIYTANQYISGDLDFVSFASIKEIGPALKEIGFIQKSSRHFERRGCPFFIEFVSPPPAIGNEPVKKMKRLKTKAGIIKLLTPTDSVKDRLAAYYHWNDMQALEQAIMVARAQRIYPAGVKRWSIKEGFEEKYHKFIAEMRRKKRG